MFMVFAPSAHGLAVVDYAVVGDDLGSARPLWGQLSADGSTVVGRISNPDGTRDVYQWREGGGTRRVAVPSEVDHPGLGVGSISRDGNLALGAFQAESGGGYTYFVWDFESDQATFIDLPSDLLFTNVVDLSADGQFVTGTATTSNGEGVAFRWNSESGTETISGFPRFGSDLATSGISADGSVIVGTSAVDGQFTRGVPFVWDRVQGVRWITNPTEDGFYPTGRPFDVSSDGAIVVGDAGDRAFVWDEAMGMRFLDPSGLGLDPDDRSDYQWAYAVSDDGAVIVGEFAGDEVGGQEVNGGFVWDDQSGMQRMDVLLRASGLDGTDRIRFALATDISSDGTRILARVLDQGGGERLVVVTIPEPTSSVLIGLGLIVAARRRRDGPNRLRGSRGRRDVPNPDRAARLR